MTVLVSGIMRGADSALWVLESYQRVLLTQQTASRVEMAVQLQLGQRRQRHCRPTFVDTYAAAIEHAPREAFLINVSSRVDENGRMTPTGILAFALETAAIEYTAVLVLQARH